VLYEFQHPNQFGSAVVRGDSFEPINFFLQFLLVETTLRHVYAGEIHTLSKTAPKMVRTAAFRGIGAE